MTNAMVLSLGTAVGLLAFGATADVTLDSNDFQNYAEIFAYEKGGDNEGGADSASSNTGTDWSDFRSYFGSAGPFDAGSTSTNFTTFSPSSPGIGGALEAVSVDMYVDVRINSVGRYYEGATASAYDHVFFTVDDVGHWSFVGDTSGSSIAGHDNSAFARIEIYDSTFTNFHGGTELTSDNGAGDFDTDIDVSGTLPPGSYVAVFQAFAQMVNFDGASSTGYAESSLRGDFTIHTACSAADLATPFGSLDFSDVLAYLLAFADSDQSADLAEPFGQFDFSDVLAFLTAFGSGCP